MVPAVGMGVTFALIVVSAALSRDDLHGATMRPNNGKLVEIII